MFGAPVSLQCFAAKCEQADLFGMAVVYNQAGSSWFLRLGLKHHWILSSFGQGPRPRDLYSDVTFSGVVLAKGGHLSALFFFSGMFDIVPLRAQG